MKTRMVLCILLLAVMAYQGLAQSAEVSTKPLKINLAYKDVVPPDIFLSYKNGGTMVQGKVEVALTIIDKGGVAYVSINNEERINKPSGDSLVFALAFNQGEELSVIARDNFNNPNAKSFIIKGQQLAKGGKIERKYYALLIGAQDYSDQAFQQLNEPIRDASQLRQTLLSKYTFEEKDITFLKNPTFQDINDAFDQLAHKISPEDFLLVFYAGHGVFDDKTNIGYWIPVDAQEKSRAKWFRNSVLVEDIGAINSKHTLLIADACFSGGIFKTRSANNNATPDIALMLKKPSRKAMTSGNLTTVPDKSVFMKYLLQALNTNENLWFPTEDLYDQVKQSMKNNSDTKPLYGEIQNVGDQGGNFVFMKREN